MSVIMVGGIPASGKSKLIRSVIGDIGSFDICNPYPLFRCQFHKEPFKLKNLLGKFFWTHIFLVK
jgi:hypothetical protein